MTDVSDFPRRYDVVYRGGGAAQPAGVVTMGADGRLSVVSAEPEFAEKLGIVVNNMNAMQYEHVEAPAPADAPRYALYSRAIGRGDPQFVPAMMKHLTSSYDLELRPS
jgi:hypothetical protein